MQHYHADTDELHNQAQAYTDIVLQKQRELHVIEQQLDIHTALEREAVLLAGQQEVLSVTNTVLPQLHHSSKGDYTHVA